MNINAIKIKIKRIEPILRKEFQVKKIGVFGSYSRGEQRKTSDVDILVEFYVAPSLLKFIAMENYLSEILGIKVDLVMKKSLKHYIGKHILDEVIYV